MQTTILRTDVPSSQYRRLDFLHASLLPDCGTDMLSSQHRLSKLNRNVWFHFVSILLSFFQHILPSNEALCDLQS